MKDQKPHPISHHKLNIAVPVVIVMLRLLLSLEMVFADVGEIVSAASV